MHGGFYFACVNCGPTDDALGNGHGACPTCGAELVRLQVPQIEREPDGIEMHWKREAAK